MIMAALREQENLLTNRLNMVSSSVQKLQKINREEDRSNAKARSFVQDLTWAFRNDVSGYGGMGFGYRGGMDLWLNRRPSPPSTPPHNPSRPSPSSSSSSPPPSHDNDNGPTETQD